MFEADVCKVVLREIKQAVFKPIFRRVYSKQMGKYRHQASIEELGDVMEFIDGGPDQDPHHYFLAFETAKALLKRQFVQGSVIVALMNGTNMIVYPGCTGGRASMQGARIAVGDVLSCRGDLAHSGAAYDKENYRLHCYVCIRGMRQKANSTEAVVFDTFRCPKCLVVVDLRGDLTAHKRECKDEGGYICEACDSAFINRNTRNRHQSRKHLQAVDSDAEQVEESGSSNGSRMEVDAWEGDGEASGEEASEDEEESSEVESSEAENNEESAEEESSEDESSEAENNEESAEEESGEDESSEAENNEESAEEESGEGSSQERDDAESEESEESDMY